MRVGVIDALAFKPSNRAIGTSQHVIRIVFTVAALNQNGYARGAGNFASCLFLVGTSGDFLAEQRFGFGNVGRDDRRQRDELLAQRHDRIARCQLRAARGHHDGIDHDVDRAVAHERFGDGIHNVSRRHHADLHRIGTDVVEHHVDLLRYERRRYVVHTVHARRVLCSKCRDDRLGE